ncbi:MAG: hypothetical protein V7638_443 [Acidobacteriota bacterium]
MPSGCNSTRLAFFFGLGGTAPVAQLRSFSRSKPELKLIDLWVQSLLPLRYIKGVPALPDKSRRSSLFSVSFCGPLKRIMRGYIAPSLTRTNQLRVYLNPCPTFTLSYTPLLDLSPRRDKHEHAYPFDRSNVRRTRP